MKPNFALSLSFEGISLLCRAQSGWRVLGDVALNADDLAAELEVLRGLVESMEGSAFCTKLILPNDQIKYLTLDTGRGTHNKRLKLAGEALEGETPYSVNELALDISAQGRKTHVAAVARETLAEAEAFAVEHQFNPVCFVSIPPDGVYPQEPQFGPTTMASDFLGGQTLKPDVDVIVITGHGPETVVPPAPPEIHVDAPITPPVADVEPKPESEPKPELAPEPEPAPIEVPERPIEPPKEQVTAPEATESPAKTPEPKSENGQVSGFSSMRAHRNEALDTNAPELGSATAQDVSGTNAPGLPPAIEPSAHADAPLRFDPTKIIARLKQSPKVDEPETSGTGSKSGSFLSSRAPQKPARSIPPAPPVPVSDLVAEAIESDVTAEPPKRPSSGTERRNMAIFGARDGEIGGKPRHLGLILTAVLFLFLIAVAIWASLFLDDGVAGLLRRDPVPQIAELEVESTPTEAEINDQTEAAPLTKYKTPLNSAGIEALTDSAVADALADEDPTDLTDSAAVEAMIDEGHPSALSENEAEARYAVTGIWERAPHQSDTPVAGSTEALYVTSIDRLLAVRDAVALPQADYETRDRAMAKQTTPPPQGTAFDFDERGLVRATAQGALSPDGVMVYLGRPAILPKSFPERKPAPGETVSQQMIIKLGKFRPKLRPDDLIEKNERASYGGRTLNELALKRPRLRPALAKAAEEKDTTPTKAAVTASLRPRQRPSNFAQLVARATPSDPVVATPAAAIISPKIPSSASVARQATIQNAINLKKNNLIGVYGTSAGRRALVRMSNGRYKKLQVGDRFDGGKVAAISDTELRYVKSGKNVILKLPKG